MKYSSFVLKTRWINILAALVPLLILIGCTSDTVEKLYYEGVTLDTKALYVSARRWEERGLEWLTQRGTQIELQHSVPEMRAIEQTNEVTIMIHGYHAADKTVSVYFKGLIEYLRDVKGYGDPIVVFDWPSVARHWVELSNDERIAFMELSQARHPDLSWEVGSYIADAEMAKSVGIDALIALIQSLSMARPDLQFNIIAHSMGCYIVSEIIKKKSKVLERVRSIIWLAPDLKYDVLEDPEFTKGLSSINKLHVFYSGNDRVLNWLSRILHTSRMLGSHGPRDISTLPNNIVLHDLSALLGKDDVHSQYLEADSPAAVLISDILSRGREGA